MMIDQAEKAAFFHRGWVRLGPDPELAHWVSRVRPIAEAVAADPAQRVAWLRCGGTWFAGVNALSNDANGAVSAEDVPPLSGYAVRLALEVSGGTPFTWDCAQVSVCYPGYPQPWEGESDAAFRFRQNRDAAHVDGLTRRDPGRRRHPGETHGFILGIPITETPPEAAPMVVWEGSHELMRSALRARLAGVAPEHWSDEDVTDAYVAARRQAFECCRRVAVHARPGEAYLVHRLALHGVAPWGEAGGTGPRMILYFRPDLHPGDPPGWWLEDP